MPALSAQSAGRSSRAGWWVAIAVVSLSLAGVGTAFALRQPKPVAPIEASGIWLQDAQGRHRVLLTVGADGGLVAQFADGHSAALELIDANGRSVARFGEPTPRGLAP